MRANLDTALLLTTRISSEEQAFIDRMNATRSKDSRVNSDKLSTLDKEPPSLSEDEIRSMIAKIVERGNKLKPLEVLLEEIAYLQNILETCRNILNSTCPEGKEELCSKLAACEKKQTLFRTELNTLKAQLAANHCLSSQEKQKLEQKVEHVYLGLSILDDRIRGLHTITNLSPEDFTPEQVAYWKSIINKRQ